MSRLVIRNGTVVTASGRFAGDVAIEGERIAAIGIVLGPRPGDEVIDAQDCYVLPGVIDAHTHIALDTGIYRIPDDFFIGTRAAACGGVTTVIDYATQFHGQTLRQAVENRRAEAEGRACVDYALHCMVTDFPPQAESELRDLVAMGVSSVKVYTTYRPNYYADDDFIFRLLRASTQDGVLVTVHCENDAIVTAATADLVARGETSLADHARSRPPLAEIEAVERMIVLAQQARSAVYLVHVSTGTAANLARRARRHGQPVLVETCPQYLLLNDELYAGPHPERVILQPPLRPRAEQEWLRELFAEGAFDVASTDHCDYTLAQKLASDKFTETPGGLPGVETLLPLVYTFTVEGGPLGSAQGKLISLERLVQLVSTNPARIFGLFPRKGVLLPGSDADIVVYDPRGESLLTADQLHGIAGYTPYEGMTVRGLVRATVCRGRVVYRDSAFLGQPGYGRFVSGQPFDPGIIARLGTT
jgi:dihydropyrimidinase